LWSHLQNLDKNIAQARLKSVKSGIFAFIHYAMNYEEIQSYFNRHCRIKLRSGREVYGVLWEEMNEVERAIYFASFIEHKKLMNKRKKQETAADPSLRLLSEDILSIAQIES